MSEKHQKIIGPISLREFVSPKEIENKDKKHIYIFGDEHTFLEGCDEEESKTIPIDKFIQETILHNIDKTIDIFLEVPYLTQKELKEFNYTLDSGYLFINTINTFANCLQVVKTNCPYKNARFHYTDVRFAEQYNFSGLMFLHSTLEGIMDILDQIYDDLEDEKLTKKKFRKSLEIIHTLLENYYHNTENYLFHPETSIRETKILKQLEFVEDSRVKELLLEKLKNFYESKSVIHHLDNEMRFLFENFNEEEYLKDPELDKLDHLTKTINEIYSTFGPIHSTVMDVYLLARLFRKFEDNDAPKNVIIYVGGDHATEYSNFLEGLGFQKINEIFSSKGCLDISSLQTPFFGGD